MEFISGSGEQLREKLQGFPSPWVNWLQAAKILVVGIMDDKIVAAYGIRGVLNTVTLYVREGYRGQGIGGQMFEKLVDAARKQGLHFLTAAVVNQNSVSLNLCSKFGSKVIKNPKNGRDVVIAWPLTVGGDLVCRFFRVACSMVPDDFLMEIAERIIERTTLQVVRQ